MVGGGGGCYWDILVKGDIAIHNSQKYQETIFSDRLTCSHFSQLMKHCFTYNWPDRTSKHNDIDMISQIKEANIAQGFDYLYGARRNIP